MVERQKTVRMSKVIQLEMKLLRLIRIIECHFKAAMRIKIALMREIFAVCHAK